MFLAGLFLLLLAVYYFLSVPPTRPIPENLKHPPKEFDRWLTQVERREIEASAEPTSAPLSLVSEQEVAKIVVFPDDISTRTISWVIQSRYVQFLQSRLKQGEKSKAAEIYPILQARYHESWDFIHKEYIPFDDLCGWYLRRQPPSSVLISFVRRHQALLNLGHEFARSQDLPTLTYQEAKMRRIYIDRYELGYLANLLCVSAYAASEDGNTSEAVRRAIDPLWLAEHYSDTLSGPQQNQSRKRRVQAYSILTLSNFLETSKLPRTALQTIQQVLAVNASVDRDYIAWLAKDYEDQRSWLLESYQKDPDDFSTYSESRYSELVYVFGIDIPNPPTFDFAGISFVNPFNQKGRVYRRFHRNFERIVKAYDEYWAFALDAWGKPYYDTPHIPPQPRVTWPWADGWMVSSEFRIDCLLFEARLNLLRAGVELLLDPASAEAAQGKDYWQDRANPWRDPFTEKALVVAGTEDERIIYSLGPDLEDQHGELIYDPTNGVASAGDLVLRLAKPKKEEK